jgi:tetratricopeptide (TPR) repeat protein
MTRIASQWRSFVFSCLLLPVWTLTAQDEHWRQRFDAGTAAANQGRYPEAREALLEAWAEAQKFRAGDMWRGLTAQALATVFFLQSDLSQAEPLYFQAKSVFESAGSEGRGALALALDGLGELRLEQGRYGESEQLLQQGLSLNQEVHGDQHHLTAQSYRHLGELYEVLNRMHDSEQFLSRSVEIMRSEKAPPGPALAISLEALARLYLVQARYDEAEGLLKQALELKRQLGLSHQAFADVLVLMGALHRLKGDPARAEPLLRKALAIYEATGDSHRFAAQTQLAAVAIAEKKYTTAERYLSEVLTSVSARLGPDHIVLAAIGCALGQAYFADGRYDRAEAWLDKSLAMQRWIFGENHPDVAKSLAVLAAVNAKLHESEAAGRHYREALEVYAKTVAPDHPEFTATHQAYSRFLKSGGK